MCGTVPGRLRSGFGRDSGKRKDGLYTPEQTSWVKIKNRNYSQMNGRRELFERRRSAVA